MGVASLVLGILGLVLFWFPYVGVVLALLALILGFFGRNKEKGKGLAMAGLIMGAIGVIGGGYWTYKATQAVGDLKGAFEKESKKALEQMKKDAEKQIKEAGEKAKEDMTAPAPAPN
jgi:Domain of unknown function (DUF4190)